MSDRASPVREKARSHEPRAAPLGANGSEASACGKKRSVRTARKEEGARGARRGGRGGRASPSHASRSADGGASRNDARRVACAETEPIRETFDSFFFNESSATSYSRRVGKLRGAEGRPVPTKPRKASSIRARRRRSNRVLGGPRTGRSASARACRRWEPRRDPGVADDEDDAPAAAGRARDREGEVGRRQSVRVRDNDAARRAARRPRRARRRRRAARRSQPPPAVAAGRARGRGLDGEAAGLERARDRRRRRPAVASEEAGPRDCDAALLGVRGRVRVRGRRGRRRRRQARRHARERPVEERRAPRVRVAPEGRAAQGLAGEAREAVERHRGATGHPPPLRHDHTGVQRHAGTANSLQPDPPRARARVPWEPDPTQLSDGGISEPRAPGAPDPNWKVRSARNPSVGAAAVARVRARQGCGQGAATAARARARASSTRPVATCENAVLPAPSSVRANSLSSIAFFALAAGSWRRRSRSAPWHLALVVHTALPVQCVFLLEKVGDLL